MKDWTSVKPPWTSQFSIPNRVDAMDCVAESFINIVYMLTGFDASPRALAKLSNTTPAGNFKEAILNTANKYGLIPYSLWPSPDIFDWNSYYADIPQDVLRQAVPISAQSIYEPNLDISPLWTGLRFSNDARHFVAQLNQTQYFDSEWGEEIKPLNYMGAVIFSQVSLKVTIGTMSNAEFVHKAGTPEYGWYLPKMSDSANKDMALNLGRQDILKPDGTVDYTKAKEVSGL